MKQNKAYNYRLYPNKEQAEFIDKTINCCRFLFNAMLSDKIDCYQENQTMLYNTPAMYKGFYTFLKEVDSLALANIQLNLEIAYKNFFRNKNIGFPKFKSKHKSKWSYTTNNLGQIRIENNRIKLPKIGFVNIIQHREYEGIIKSATITKTRTNKYFVSVLCEYEKQVEQKLITENNPMVGLDYSSPHFFVSSDNEIADMPHYFRDNEIKLAREQRKLSRKQKRSKNYYKQKLKIALCHEKVSNQRKDWLHKKSTEIIDKYDVFFLEGLDMKNMSQSLKLGKATIDNGFGFFRTLLEYKLKDNGKNILYLDRFAPTSKVCSICGYKNTNLKLCDRHWTCPNCGTHHDRDFNAAKNILEMGKKILFGGRNDRNSLVGYSGI